MTLEKKQEKLQERLHNEYNLYLQGLLQTTNVNILNHSYETVIKEEITYISYNLNDDEIDFINKNKMTLQTLYDIWLDSDYNINQNISGCIIDYIIS